MVSYPQKMNESRIFQLRELKLPLNVEFQAALVSKFNMPEPPFLNMVRFAACSIVQSVVQHLPEFMCLPFHIVCPMPAWKCKRTKMKRQYNVNILLVPSLFYFFLINIIPILLYCIVAEITQISLTWD